MDAHTTRSARETRRAGSPLRLHTGRLSRVHKACAGLAIAGLAATAAHADCVDGSRERSPQEQRYADQVAAALKAALPAAPVPLALEREPQVVVQPPCKDTPNGAISALVSADYAASSHYADRVKLTLRTNYAYPGAEDLVMGTLPRKAAGFRLHNLVVKVDGYKAPYVESVRQAVDRPRLQALIDQPLPETPPPAAWVVAAPGAPASPRPPQAAQASTAPATPASPSVNATAADTGTAPDRPPQPQPAQAAIEQARDAVNRLRGLLGR